MWRRWSRRCCCTSSASTPLLLRLVARRSPHRVLPAVPRRLPLCVLDRLVQRDAAALARDRREEASHSARHCPVRPDGWRHREPERHGAVRRDHGPVSRAGLRAGSVARAAGPRDAHVDSRGDRHGWSSRRIAAYGNDRGAVGRHSRRGHGPHPRRGPLPRHVQDDGQRQRRPGDCGARRGSRLVGGSEAVRQKETHS